MTHSGLVRGFRGRNALYNLFELWIALSGIVTCVIYFFARDSLSISLAITIGDRLSDLWNAGYGISGAFIIYGLLRPSPRVEIAGLSILGGATAVLSTAVLYTFGLHGVSTGITFLTLTIAAWIRAWFVFWRAKALAQEGKLASHRSRL